MRILVVPRDPNPYQELLYSEMRRLGVRTNYIASLTSSHTLNLLLLPFEVAAHRMTGARLIHLHWVFVFTFPGAAHFPALRRAAYAWFVLWLWSCRRLGMHLVWTAHNVLPHEQVFPDDVAGRRALVCASDLVLAHSETTLSELAALGAVARTSAVIEHGPMLPRQTAGPPRCLRAPTDACRFLFFGHVLAYKGVDDLLHAFLALPAHVDAHLTVAGRCDDPRLRSRLRALARLGGTRVDLRLEFIPNDEVASLISAADVVVLPFRAVTTSGSAMLALSHGRPLIVPDLPALACLPDGAVVRYSGGITALTTALAQFARLDGETLTAMSAEAGHYACRTTWPEIAEKTVAHMRLILGDRTDKETR